jgi:hypothetical protein
MMFMNMYRRLTLKFVRVNPVLTLVLSRGNIHLRDVENSKTLEEEDLQDTTMRNPCKIGLTCTSFKDMLN